MERRHRYLTATILAVVACSCAAIPVAADAAGAAEPGWTTYHPAHQPVTLALPTTWAMEAPPQGIRFYALFGKDAYVELAVSTYKGEASDFVATESTSVRKAYLKQDPKATLRSRTIALPAGKAFEVIARLAVKAKGAPSQALSIYDYSFLNRGHVYEFLYAVETAKTGSYTSTFDRSVRSIRFTS
jgi:hypothetical protein